MPGAGQKGLKMRVVELGTAMLQHCQNLSKATKSNFLLDDALGYAILVASSTGHGGCIFRQF
ncbi:unnamed protein product [Mycetohabitans rhizoxinica HKI 454]|uniref:Uncharacterized protein n=1 Tax=Mycetohabitans rhizoxinica (strain DSM 19002 / CIP 109453 / HKI 454) TaxID=882378 RepID=E5APJ7_MYCRK|nr:unnamed protein product [Mycetohabitans rhizoxinica HKI 454]